MTVALICGLSLTSCKDDESGVANAVIVSTRAIEFPASGTLPVAVNVTADGYWTVEAPEWITVTPSSGDAGRTEVKIEVAQNIKGDAPDRPRKFALNFKGEKSLSAFQVMIQQAGNKYRDLEPISIQEVANLEDDEAAMLSGVTVFSNTEKGIVATDGTQFIYVTGVHAENGTKVDVMGSKFKADGFAYLEGETITEKGSGTVPSFTAEDITNRLDNYKSNKQTIVKATGAFDGKVLKVEGQTNDLQVVDADKAYNMDKLKGHQLEITGVYAGTASPVVKLIATSINDLGLNETVLFSDDFEWFLETNILTYTGSDGIVTSDNVGDNLFKGVYNPQSGTLKTPDGKSVWDLLTEKGYNMFSTTAAQAKKSVGCAKNYLKMAITTYTAALQLPAMPEAGDGAKGAKLSFDWVPFAGSGGVYDPTEIVVVITNNGIEQKIAIDALSIPNNTPYEWHHEEVDLSEYTINKDTRITLRNADAQYPESTAVNKTCRWFLDNIKVYIPKE